METINTEIVVSSLFNVGFDKVDLVLFTFVLAKISVDDRNKQFRFQDQETSPTFNRYVDYNGLIFKLKAGLQMDTNISQFEGFEWPLGRALTTNRYLIEYLNNLDYSEIILKKAELYGMQNINESTFSSKELRILKQLNSIKNKTLNRQFG